MGDETSRNKRTALALLTEGNFVVLHTRQEWPGDANWAGMDIFRFEGGRIVEPRTCSSACQPRAPTRTSLGARTCFGRGAAGRLGGGGTRRDGPPPLGAATGRVSSSIAGPSSGA
jgi:hypothetical protein